ncbi:MAG: GntR family transcriptional regulator [Planctomycetaceae bacterium]|nr:GntR family transcriptional regulator [Planctomycetaceae bacterium]
MSEVFSNRNKKPVHSCIFDYVQKLIFSGEYDSKRKLPTDHQLMRQFGVSRATVVKAMRDLEHRGLVDRRPGIGSFAKLNAHPHHTLFSVLIAGLGDTEFFEPICAAIALSCHKNNHGLLWGDLTDIHKKKLTEQSCQTIVRGLVAKKVSGVFFVPDELDDENENNDSNQMLVDAISNAGIKIVLIDRDICTFPSSGPHDVVGIDNFRAGFDQTNHLIQNGCRRILYLTRPGILSTKTARIAGYCHAMEQAGLERGQRWICQGNVRDALLIDEILSHKPDGIACFHDPIAAELIQSLLLRNIAIPRQIKIIGLDDVKYSQLIQVPLTTIRQPCRDIGIQATNLMIERIHGVSLPPRHVFMPTELIVRDSTSLQT